MKIIIFWCLCLVMLLSIGNLSYAQSPTDLELNEDEQLIEFTTNRFTLPNLHVTPDKKHIIFDVLGDIYQVPIEGGKAEVLLQDLNWKRAGKLSPDGKTLAYVSDETGNFQVWTYNLETRKKSVYPIIEAIHYPLFPYWKGNNELIIPGDEGLYSYPINNGEPTLLRKAKEDEKSVLNATNRTLSVNNKGSLACLQKDGALWIYDFGKGRDLFVGDTPEKKWITHFNTSPNGRYVLFYVANEDDYRMQHFKVWDLKTDKIKELGNRHGLKSFTTLNYGYDFIDDTTLILDKEGEIVRMDIKTGEYKSIPIEVDVKKVIKKPLQRAPQTIRDSIITAKVLRNPVTRIDLDTIYFGAFGKLHTYSKTTGKIKEVFPNKNRFEVSPSLSPNGKYLAYTTWNDWEMGHLYVREIRTGKETQITSTPGRYINPAWSPDGREIVFIADETEAKIGIPRQTPGNRTGNYHLDVQQIHVFEDEKFNKKVSSTKIKRIYPLSQLPRRFYPIPVYHPNGKSIYLSKRENHKDLSTYAQINLNPRVIINEKPIPYHTDEALISPDAKHIAFIFDEQVWIDDFPFKTDIKYKGKHLIDIELPMAQSIFEIAPSYLSWQDNNTLMWGSAEEVYTYDLRMQKTQKVAEIKVQKPRAVPKTNYALTNARIITINKNDDKIEKGTILIKNNRIETVGPVEEVEVPYTYEIFNLKGKTIIPGLVDVHAHYLEELHEINPQQNTYLLGNIAYGVTSIYDPSVNAIDFTEQAQMIETGDLLGPRVFASGNIIFEDPGRHQHAYIQIDTLEDALRILKSTKKLGVSGPIKEYLIRNKNKRTWLWKAAKSQGIGITTHQKYLSLSLSRVINGYTAIEHEIGHSLFQKDVKQLVGQSGVHYTPTFMVSPRIGDLFIDYTNKEKQKLIHLNGKILYQNNYAQYSFNLSPNRKEFYDKDMLNRKEEIKRASSVIKEIKQLGGKISVGGHGNPLPGIGSHIELWSFTYKNGLSNYEALQVATKGGAEKLALQEEIGSIEKGKLADLVILNKNPLDTIFDSTNILYTIQNGNIYEVNTMKKIYPSREELKPWGWNSPIVIENMEHIYIAK